MSKNDKIAKLKELVKHLVVQELKKDDEIEEVSTTASAGAANPMGTGIYYDTPKAFSSGSAVGHKSPEVGGYKKIKESVITERIQPKQFNKDFDMAMNLVIKQANNLKGELAKHPIKRNVNKLKAVQKLFKKFVAPALVKANRDIGMSFDFTNIRKRLTNGEFKSVLQYSIMNRLGGNSYDSNSFYGLEDKEKKLLDRIYSEFRKLTNLMDDANLESVNESYSSIFIEISKAIKANRPDELDAIKDLGEEYDIGRVLYMARKAPRSLRKAVDDRIKERKRFIKSKNLKEVNKQEVSALQKLHKGLEKLKNDYIKIAKAGDRTLMDREYNNYYETILTARKEIGKLLVIMKNKQMLGEGRYHDWRNDESMTPKQKVGRSMREIRDALNELDKTVKMNLKLKTELNMNSKDYWKNTHKALTKISERLVKMANKIGNLK